MSTELMFLGRLKYVQLGYLYLILVILRSKLLLNFEDGKGKAVRVPY
jgi:hypothetical protein